MQKLVLQDLRFFPRIKTVKPRTALIFKTALIWSLLLGLKVQAGIPAQHFFRSPDSLFASGQASFSDLEKKKFKEFQEVFFIAQKDGRSFKVPSDFIIRDIDLSTRIGNTRTGKLGLVIGIKGPWISVVDGSGKRDWWNLSEAMPVPDDLGLAQNINPILLRKSPNWKAESLHEIRGPTKFRILKISDSWAEVALFTDLDQKGWVEMGALVTKYDFASFVLPKNGKWTSVKYRQGSELVTGGGQKIKIETAQAIMTRPDLGLISKEMESFSLKQRSYMKIQSWESVSWAVSRLQGHGEVFWKTSAIDQQLQNTTIAQTVSYDEVLKRPIFSVAFHPKNPRIGLISAEGIYMTEDGITWRKVPQFQNDNLPVAISTEHEFFVGDHRSQDSGKTFKPFLKWEQLATLMESRTHKGPRILRLIKIEPRTDKRVSIEVDNGIKSKQFIGSTKYGLVTQWKFESSTERITE